MSGLYLHIPFCASRCLYCGFYSTTFRHLREQYLEALCHEMRLRGCPSIGTIYLGGGTPSQLSYEMLRELFNTINEVYSPDYSTCEVTIECNPDDLTPGYAMTLAQLPVNRVSLGIQSFDESRLRFLRRRHTALQAERAVHHLRAVGIHNISIDLMFGFPGQTLADLVSDIEKALSLNVEHISIYSLMYDEGTPMKQMLDNGEIKEIDEDIYIIMYNTMADMLESHGYEHYEISNFAKPGFKSRHNSSYWHDIPYIGIGAGAHSYDGEKRSSNICDIHKYISSIGKGIIPCESEVLSERDHFNDLVTTALRTREGLDMSYVKEKFGTEYIDHIHKTAHRHLANGLLSADKGHLHLTRSGIAISDTVMSDLIML